MNNPWGLTPREAETITAIVDTGCHKRAARKLGVSQLTTEQHMRNVRRKMGAGEGDRLRVYLMWDRHLRGTNGHQS